ncbi:hypothetical protein A6R68_11006 [Neotoma lepida]|uniref:Uncharacterized protein n=1 Tax=Neotoma lepida TaxID=56216 RepID=A0A1A6FV90_NEOLE|nr:hypothetical protein A6R68_11006 [Neotoma lepida]
MSFLAGLGLAAGLALLLYCCPPDPKVLPGTRRILAFSPVIIDRHVSRYLLAFLADDLGGLLDPKGRNEDVDHHDDEY